MRAHARGFCASHYSRWRRHGNPLAGGPPLHASADDAFVARVAWDGDHLIWLGALNKKGYGVIGAKLKSRAAHRFSFAREYGPIPEGMYVDHICHTPACVLPEHLRLASPGQNASNRAGAMGRSKTGVRGVLLLPTGDYEAIVQKDRKSHRSHTVRTLEEATVLVRKMRLELFGDFAGKG